MKLSTVDIQNDRIDRIDRRTDKAAYSKSCTYRYNCNAIISREIMFLFMTGWTDERTKQSIVNAAFTYLLMTGQTDRQT